MSNILSSPFLYFDFKFIMERRNGLFRGVNFLRFIKCAIIPLGSSWEKRMTAMLRFLMHWKPVRRNFYPQCMVNCLFMLKTHFPSCFLLPLLYLLEYFKIFISHLHSYSSCHHNYVTQHQWQNLKFVHIKVSHLACIKYHLDRHRNSFPIISR